MSRRKTSNGPAASEELLVFIERWERLQEEKEGIAADQKDVMAEAKGRGYDVKTIKEIIKLRKLDPQERREREALLDTYKAALGMLDGTPLGKWAVERMKKPHEAAGEADERYAEAVQVVISTRSASTAHLQRAMSIGYNRAAALIERMQNEGIVSEPDDSGKREVIAKPEDAPPPAPAQSPPENQEPELTIDDARRMGREAAEASQPVTSNPFPAFDERRATWDEAWCSTLGSDGMDIPDALKPTPKVKPKEPEDA